MTREEIIWLARQAGLTGLMEGGIIDSLERFAATVADVERANVTLAAFQVAERQIAAEREACAQICEREARRYGEVPEDYGVGSALTHYQQGYDDGASISAEKIRARGQE